MREIHIHYGDRAVLYRLTVHPFSEEHNIAFNPKIGTKNIISPRQAAASESDTALGRWKDFYVVKVLERKSIHHSTRFLAWNANYDCRIRRECGEQSIPAHGIHTIHQE